MNVALCANLLLIPLLLVERNGISPFLIGILLFNASLFGILSSILTGKVIPTFGNIKMINVSTIIMIFGFLVIGLISNANLFVIISLLVAVHFLLLFKLFADQSTVINAE
ncbi:hypothetical protein [Peribacillus simplex]|uniref:hypothetical protein n=1 Tax=Peribacillus simplex TaxID=1478 RepID=UPI00366C521D